MKKPPRSTRASSAHSSPILWRPDSDATRRAALLFKSCDILFLVGPAATGKTHTALGLGLPYALDQGQKCIVARPMVQAAEEEDIGFLPGEVDDKFAPYFAPFNDCLKSLTLEKPTTTRSWFEAVPINFMRGRTFESTIILDEAQNCSAAGLKLVLTRMGKGAKLLITGDPNQCDIDDSGLVSVANALRKVPRVGLVVFDSVLDNRRHDLVPEILKAWPKRK